jgi:hypothetical protein
MGQANVVDGFSRVRRRGRNVDNVSPRDDGHRGLQGGTQGIDTMSAGGHKKGALPRPLDLHADAEADQFVGGRVGAEALDDLPGAGVRVDDQGRHVGWVWCHMWHGTAMCDEKQGTFNAP